MITGALSHIPTNMCVNLTVWVKSVKQTACTFMLCEVSAICYFVTKLWNLNDSDWCDLKMQSEESRTKQNKIRPFLTMKIVFNTLNTVSKKFNSDNVGIKMLSCTHQFNLEILRACAKDFASLN
jgi:hypothetical protein